VHINAKSQNLKISKKIFVREGAESSFAGVADWLNKNLLTLDTKQNTSVFLLAGDTSQNQYSKLKFIVVVISA
jgi:hypothetical protein